RGGGFAQHKAPINLQGATNCIITGVLVTARGVVNNQIPAGLDGIVRLHGSSSNNMVIVNYTDGVLKSGGAPVVKASYSGSNNTWVVPPSGLVLHRGRVHAPQLRYACGEEHVNSPGIGHDKETLRPGRTGLLTAATWR